MKAFVIVPLVCLVFFVSTAYSIKCYQCGGDACKGAESKECPASLGMIDACMEIMDDKGSAVRSCTMKSACNALKSTCEQTKCSLKYKCCQTDGCNGGAFVKPALMISVLMPVAIMARYLM